VCSCQFFFGFLVAAGFIGTSSSEVTPSSVSAVATADTFLEVTFAALDALAGAAATGGAFAALAFFFRSF
jgi:hypothetical protein